MANGQPVEASSHFRRAIEIDAAYAEAHNNLGKVLSDQGSLDEAVDQLSKALAIKDTYADAHYNLAGVLVRQNRLRDAMTHYRAALTLSPASPPVLMDTAWLLSTSPNAEIRDPRGGILLAERAVELTSRRSPRALDVVAAAYAAAGRFEDAVLAAQAALDLLARDRPADGSGELAGRLTQYQRRTAHIDERGTGPVSLR